MTFETRAQRRLRRRTVRGDDLSRALAAGMVVGEQNPTHTYWVLPVRVENREAVVAALRGANFDATARSSLIVVPNDVLSPRYGESAATRPSPTGRGSELESPLAPWLGEIVFLPGGENMPDADWEKLLSILQEVACVAEPPAEARTRGAVGCLWVIMTAATPTYRWNTSAAAEAYDQAAPVIHPYYVAVQDQILGALSLAVEEPFVLVDLGGGSGRLAERVLERFKSARAVVVDQSEPFLALAERRLARFAPRAKFLQRRLAGLAPTWTSLSETRFPRLGETRPRECVQRNRQHIGHPSFGPG